MDNLLDQCRWPPLTAPYDQALRDAVQWIVARFEVLGIVASGTIIRGNPKPASDLDIYVIHAQPRRQRIQTFFNGIPAEIFVNPVSAIERYFIAEHKAGRPLTAHMLATGFVVLDRDPIVEDLRQRARDLIAERSDPAATQLTMLRYSAALELEDALDVVATDSATANMILGMAVRHMLQFRFWMAHQPLPRDKDLFEALDTLDPRLVTRARDFFMASEVEWRTALAKEMADLTIEAHGFFEWESPLEDV